MLDGQVIVSGGGLVGGGCRPIVPGATIEGDQVTPPSKLNSVNTSKKLSIAKSLGLVRTLVLPSDALEGLSRTITPPGKVPPDKLKESISVLKKRVGPESILLST